LGHAKQIQSLRQVKVRQLMRHHEGHACRRVLGLGRNEDLVLDRRLSTGERIAREAAVAGNRGAHVDPDRHGEAAVARWFSSHRGDGVRWSRIGKVLP